MEDDSFEARFARFKKQQAATKSAGAGSDNGDDGDDAGDGESVDTLGRLPSLPVIGGKRRRKGTSDASGYSLSSSAMFRNAGLTDLDERYDQVCTPPLTSAVSHACLDRETV